MRSEATTPTPAEASAHSAVRRTIVLRQAQDDRAKAQDDRAKAQDDRAKAQDDRAKAQDDRASGHRADNVNGNKGTTTTS
jgi:hypothetical protein